MKCEICKRAEAVTAITVTRDGARQELYVCAACAAAAKAGRKAPDKGHAPKVTVVGRDSGNVPEPLVEEFVKATLGFMKGMAEAEEEKDRICPSCKATWEHIKETGRLGCPACWKAFAREIRETFLGMEYGRVHLGAAPDVRGISDAHDARTALERELKNAIAREDYLRAAEIKRQLDTLGPANKETT